MALDTGVQKKIQRIAEIVEQIEADADPKARAMAAELLESLMALHGAALERILQIAGEAGEDIIQRCGRDELVSGLLVLYGLHPQDMRTRVEGALEKARTFLGSRAAWAELVSVGTDGAVTVRLHVKPGGCGSTAAGLQAALEAAIQEAAPDACAVMVESTGGAPAESGFVPVGKLLGAALLTAAMGGRAPAGGE